MEKAKQSYDKYCVGTKIEKLIQKNSGKLLDGKIIKPGICRTKYFSKANPVDPQKFLRTK